MEVVVLKKINGRNFIQIPDPTKNGVNASYSLTNQNRDNFIKSFRQNLFSNNLWFSIFIDQPWTYFNRTARSSVAIMTISLSAISNIMFYRDIEGNVENFRIKMAKNFSERKNFNFERSPD